MREGAWINSVNGQFAWVSEHASWIQKEENAQKVGLSHDVWLRIKDMRWDFNGGGRAEILAIIMSAGFIRMRGHGSYWTFEFTIKTYDALWACLSFLVDYAGPYTMCRFNNLRTGEQIEKGFKEFQEMMEEDPEEVMRIASVMTEEQNPKQAKFGLLDKPL